MQPHETFPETRQGSTPPDRAGGCEIGVSGGYRKGLDAAVDMRLQELGRAWARHKDEQENGERRPHSSSGEV
jgi:hypothetical protein